MTDRAKFLIQQPYGDLFDRTLEAFYGACRLWFTKGDIGKLGPEQGSRTEKVRIELTNQVFHLAFGGDNNKYHPHVYEGDVSLRGRRATASRPYRPTRLLLNLVGRTKNLEQRIEKYRSALNRPHKDRQELANVELLFSPLYFARLFLTDPDFTANDAYVHSLIRAEIFASAYNWSSLSAQIPSSPSINDAREFIYKAIDFSSVTECLQKIESHWRSRDNIEIKDATDFIVMHLLASRGLMVLRLGRLPEKQGKSRRPLATRRTLLESKGVGFIAGQYEFRVVPEVRRLPTASELVNQLDGIPLPLPGIDTVLLGGLRMSENHGLVCRFAGKSGSGKTSFALGLSLALAPLGTRTIYLSAEEQPADLRQRMETLTPDHIRRMQLYNEIRSKAFLADYVGGSRAEKLNDVGTFLEKLSETFSEKVDSQSKLPPGLTDLLIILDGVHELFDGSGQEDLSAQAEKLRELVEVCRGLRAIVVILTAKEPSPVLDQLDYLVDLVGVLDVVNSEADSDPTRRITITKTRRQVAHIGTHLLHISGRRGVRISPNVATQANTKRSWKWVEARDTDYIDFLLKPRMRRDSKVASFQQEALVKLYDRSQILVTGLGSGSKSAFAMRVLSAPLVSAAEIYNFDLGSTEQLNFDEPRDRLLHSQDSFAAQEDQSDFDDDLTVAEYAPLVQDGVRRALILSFLYPDSFYRKTWKRMRGGVSSGIDRLMPNRRLTFDFDVHTFVPGYLHAEDFLRIVNRLLDRHELLGTPYDGVLIDGLHNVYLQFPLLERSEMVWPMFYETLRTRGLTVVTTHTYFTVDSGVASYRMDADVDSARRRVAPLLHALVQATDFSLRITPVEVGRQHGSSKRLDLNLDLRIDVLGGVGQRVRSRPSDVYWDRDTFTAVRAVTEDKS